MAVRQIKNDIFYVGAIDWDRRLFDELIPLPDGTSYNSYLIKGSEKIALIDTVDPTKENELIKNLKDLNVSNIDYIVCNHAEQDHSGAIPKILELFSEAKVVTNQKCREQLMELLLVPEDKFITIKDEDTLSLGNKTLQFFITPWTHWPETMFTYLKEDNILFPCDFFGSHLATSDLFVRDREKVYFSAKRYYAEIMMPFRNVNSKYIRKVKEIGPAIIAASHGPLYDKPDFILNAYEEWSSTIKNEVIIVYVSMHNSTLKMVEFLTESLMKKNITVKVFKLTNSDIGEIAMALVDAATIVIATPTVLTGAHPAAVYATFLVNALKPKLKFASIVGSYGWGGKMIEQLTGMLSNLKVELIEPVLIKGYPKEKDFTLLSNLANEIERKHKELNIS